MEKGSVNDVLKKENPPWELKIQMATQVRSSSLLARLCSP
jgi:hypothetical protein